jgi:hypothetical protein
MRQLRSLAPAGPLGGVGPQLLRRALVQRQDLGDALETRPIQGWNRNSSTLGRWGLVAHGDLSTCSYDATCVTVGHFLTSRLMATIRLVYAKAGCSTTWP